MRYGDIVTWYINTIEQLNDVLKVVPYNSNNKTVIIPKLAPIIIESGSLLDTAFFSLYVGNKKKPNIIDYQGFFEARCCFSSVQTLFYSEEPLILQPFEKWKNTKDSAPLDWWNSYNKLKHDRINAMPKSTLENAVNVLVALTQFLVRCVDFFDALYRTELIISNINPDYIKKEFEMYWHKPSCEISMENNLFLTPVGSDVFRTTPKMIHTGIIPSNKLKRFFVKWG